VVCEIGAVCAGRGRADEGAAAPAETASLGTCANTAGAAFGRPTAGVFAAGLRAADFLAARVVEGDFFKGDIFKADIFAAGLTAAFAPTFSTTFAPTFAPAPALALIGALAARFVTVDGKTPADLAADFVALAAWPAVPAVVRDFFDTAMVSPESGQQCDDYPASVIASCISPIGLSNRISRFFMYIVAIAWLYVVILMTLTETSFIAGLVTLVFYGIAPLALFLWLMGTPERRRRQRSREQPDE